MSRRDAIRDKIIRGCGVSFAIGEHAPCWVWKGPTSGGGRGGGYGRMSLDGATVAVHRTMFVVECGPIPPRKQIDHTCGNRLCCNPAHLEMVTHKEN